MNIMEVLVQWSKYNDLVNNDLIRIFESLGSRWEEDAGSYFKSPRGVLNHLLIADVVWLRRLAENGVLAEVIETRLSVFPSVQYGMEVFEDWADFKAKRKLVDGLWIDVAQAFPENRLGDEIVYKTIQGKHMRLSLGGVVFHLFNHHTHHRGALSQILDAWGVANDYSGLNRAFGQLLD